MLLGLAAAATARCVTCVRAAVTCSTCLSTLLWLVLFPGTASACAQPPAPAQAAVRHFIREFNWALVLLGFNANCQNKIWQCSEVLWRLRIFTGNTSALFGLNRPIGSQICLSSTSNSILSSCVARTSEQQVREYSEAEWWVTFGASLNTRSTQLSGLQPDWNLQRDHIWPILSQTWNASVSHGCCFKTCRKLQCWNYHSDRCQRHSRNFVLRKKNLQSRVLKWGT